MNFDSASGPLAYYQSRTPGTFLPTDITSTSEPLTDCFSPCQLPAASCLLAPDEEDQVPSSSDLPQEDMEGPSQIQQPPLPAHGNGQCTINTFISMNRPTTDSVYRARCPSVCNLSTSGNPASRWTGVFWSESVLLIFVCLKTFLCFCHFDDFLR